MIKYEITAGTVDFSVVIRIVDSTDGTPETAVVFNTSGIDLQYRREGAASVAITEVTLAALTTAHTDGGFLHIGNGYYRLDLPDAACASGATGVLVHGTVTGMVVIGAYIQLVAYNPFDAVRLGLTALPNVVSGSAGAIPTTGTGANQLSVSSGLVTLAGVTHTGAVIPTVTTTTTATNVTTVSGLAANVITATAIATDAITAAKIASGAITSTQVADGFLTSTKLASGAITATSIASGALTAAKFAAGAFDAVWSVTARLLTAGTNIVLAKGTEITGFNDLSAAQVNTEADTAITDAALATASALSAVDTDVANIQTRLPAALESGRIAAVLSPGVQGQIDTMEEQLALLLGFATFGTIVTATSATQFTVSSEFFSEDDYYNGIFRVYILANGAGEAKPRRGENALITNQIGLALTVGAGLSATPATGTPIAIMKA